MRQWSLSSAPASKKQGICEEDGPGINTDWRDGFHAVRWRDAFHRVRFPDWRDAFHRVHSADWRDAFHRVPIRSGWNPLLQRMAVHGSWWNPPLQNVLATGLLGYPTSPWAKLFRQMGIRSSQPCSSRTG